MEPIQFPEQTVVLGKGQPQYRLLPVCQRRMNPIIKQSGEAPIYEYTCRYNFSELELAQILTTRSMFFTQTGSCFHPILPQVENHWKCLRVIYDKQSDGSFNFDVPLTDGHLYLKEVPLSQAIEVICAAVPGLEAEFIYFEQKPSLEVGEDGILKVI